MPKAIGVRLDEDYQQRLVELGKRQDRSPHYLMKRAIEKYVDEVEEDEREYEITMKRWHDYLETGISIPHEEVMANLEAYIKEKSK